MPTSSIDTFFACTIIVAAALLATAFLGATMQTSIAGTSEVNKPSYLKAIADHLVTNSGSPSDWGKSTSVPDDFGLAASDSTVPYELDMDKITRLNSQNIYCLSYVDLAESSKLTNMALGITLSQILTINITQTNNSTVGGDTAFTFSVLISVDSQPVSANLHCYLVANSYVTDVANSTSDGGVGDVTVQVPSQAAGNAMLVVFARASFDDRETSYAIYDFASQQQQSTPTEDVLTLSPLGNTLNLATNFTGLTVENGYVFSFQFQQTLALQGLNNCSIPNLVDKSPFVIVVGSSNNGVPYQAWVTYPQIPLKAGSSFSGSEQNVFTYIVTVKGALYKLTISLGDVHS